MIYFIIGLIALLVLFLYSACRVSSECSRIEELEELELAFYKNMKK